MDGGDHEWGAIMKVTWISNLIYAVPAIRRTMPQLRDP
jgi:hypothetical protein